ncbi:MAG: hypothetical protein ABFS86_16585 [Planctomycetota bacterium]
MSGSAINCGWVTENLLAGNRGELSGAETRSLDDHVSTCDDCRHERDGMALLREAIDSIPMLEPAAGSFSNLKEMIEKGQPAAAQPRRGVLFSPLFYGAGALVAAAAVFLLYLLPSSPTPPAPLTPVAGSLTADGTPVAAGVGFTPAPGSRIVADTLALVAFAAPRAGELTLAAGTTLTCLSEGRYRIDRGRMLAEISPGEGTLTFETPMGGVEVTGTIFDLDLTDGTLILSVLRGAVVLRTGDKPVRLDSGTAITVTAAGIAGTPRRVDPDATRRWCSSPTARLVAEPGRLLLTLSNETVRPLAVKPWDPSVGVYALRVEGQEYAEDLKLVEAMLIRRPGERGHILTLAPGEAWEIAIDPRKLGLSPGIYGISAVYSPYTTDLPDDAWRGVLVSPPVVVEVP